MSIVKYDANMKNHRSVVNANYNGNLKRHLALVSADTLYIEEISGLLLARGFEVHVAAGGHELLALQAKHFYDVIILDTDIPGDDDLVTLRRLTRNAPSPGLIVRSDSRDEVDRIIALEVGADDCIGKSCHPREILARVHAVLRRISIHRETNDTDVSFQKLVFKSEFRFLGWTLDCNDRRLFSPTRDNVIISSVEYKILHCLFIEPGVVHSRHHIGGTVLNVDPANDYRSTDVYISRLRKKFALHTNYKIIETIRGVGYRSIKDIQYYRGL